MFKQIEDIFFSMKFANVDNNRNKSKMNSGRKNENKLEKEAIYNRKTGGNFIDYTKSAITMVNTHTAEFFFLNTPNNGSQLYSTKMSTPKMQIENWDWKCLRWNKWSSISFVRPFDMENRSQQCSNQKISSTKSFKFYHSTHTYIWPGSISPYSILACKLLNLNYCKLLSWLNCDCFCVCTGRSGPPNHYHSAESAHYIIVGCF